jgi:cytochrome b561
MTDRSRYDAVAIALHWLTALAVLGLIVMGLVMTRERPGSHLQFVLYQLHKSVGITVLALTIARLAWRLGHKPPPLPATMPGWEKLAAHAGHLALYGFMVGMPLSGWALVSASTYNIPTVLYGVVPFPHLPVLPTLPNKAAVEAVLRQVHDVAGWLLMATLAGHVGAALRHHVLLKDDVLRRMLPRFGGNHP